MLQKDLAGDEPFDATIRSDAAFLVSVLAASSDCIKVLDLEGRLLFMSEGGRRIMEVEDFDMICGCPWPSFGESEWRVKAERALATAKAGGIGHFRGQAPTVAGTMKWWDVRVTPIIDPDGGISRLLSVSRDISDQVHMETRLAENEERLSSALAAAGMVGVWDYDIVNDLVRADARFAELYGVDPQLAETGAERAHFERNIFVDDIPAYRDAFERVMTTASEFECEYRLVQPNGTMRWVLARGRRICDADGTPVRLPGAVVDITERKAAEERGAVVNRELAHRITNLLAVVGAIVSQTLRHAASPQQGASAIKDRLRALDAAQEILLDAEADLSSVHKVVAAAIEPHLRRSTLLTIDGPRIALSSNQLLGISLALHELSTNAMKYGALSVDGGHIRVRWSSARREDGERGFTLEWQETGGPAVEAPTRRGFGRDLLERVVGGYFKGKGVLTYAPDGVRYRIDGVLS